MRTTFMASVSRLTLALPLILATALPVLASSGGLAFNGSSSYVTFGPAPGLGLPQFTLETWFQRTGAGVVASTGTGGVQAAPLLAKGRGEADGSNVDMNWFLGIRSSDGVLVADFEEGATGASPGLNHPVAGVTPIADGQWHHAAATYDGTQWQLFLDGQLEAQVVVGQPPRADSIQHASLGTALTSTGTPQGYFDGVLDEARVWNYARTATEIADGQYRQILAEAGLVGRWSLDETTGTTAFDTSGTNIHGTLVNGPVWTVGYPFVPAPTVALVAPGDQAVVPGPTVSFICTAEDSSGLVSATLYVGLDGQPETFQPVATNAVSGTNAVVSFPAALADSQDYVWNCMVVNSGGEPGWAPANFRLRVDGNYPDFPVLVSPADASTGVAVPATLQVQVDDPNGDALTVSFYGREILPQPSDFTLAVLPDTQNYAASATYAGIATMQTQWILDNRANWNIVFVSHEGDLVNTYNDATQWNRINTSMSLLDGVVPYGVLPGNHDLPTTLYNQYFPFTRYHLQPWYGGHCGTTNDSSFQFFSAAGMDFLVLHVQFNPPAEVLAWADAVLKNNATRRAILVTHGFLNATGGRSVGVMGSTEHLWTQLVLPNPNVGFVLCGHETGEYARTDVVDGREVHQLLADYQGRSNGGNGWMRLMRFAPSEDKVYVETYSPYLDQFEEDADSKFTLNFPMRGFRLIAQADNVPSGSVASATWMNLSWASQYEWYVTVTDSTGRSTRGPNWTFTTSSGDLVAPVISNVAVVDITDTTARITWTTDEPADSEVRYGLDAGYGSTVSQGPLVTAHSIVLTDLSPSTSYHFEVASRDGAGNAAASGDFVFSTLPANIPPVAEAQEITTNEDTPVVITLTGSDGNGDALTYLVMTSPAHGTLTGTPPVLTNWPSANYFGTDTFDFAVTDGKATSSLASVSITIVPVNDPPLAQAGPDQTVDAGAQVSLDGSGSSDPDGPSLIFQWQQTAGPAVALSDPGAAQPSFGAPSVEVQTELVFSLTVSDGSLVSSDSVAITVKPAVDDALVLQNPVVTFGTLGGDGIAGTQGQGDGLVQTVTEVANGSGGRSSLQVEYALHTSVASAAATGLTLYFAGGWSQLDANDSLNIALWNGSSWQNITDDLLADGVYVPPANPGACIDANGDIRVRFTDSTAARNEKKDTLTIDLLFAQVTAGPPDLQPPAAPTGLAAAGTGLDVILTWNANDESDLAGYRVYRSGISGGGYELLTAEILPSPAYTDHVSAAGDYFYVVSAVDRTGNESTNSQEVAVTATAPTLSVHVEAITMSVEKPSKQYRALADVLVHNQGETPQVGVTVVGDWYFKGSLVETGVSAVTSAGGAAVISSSFYQARSGNVFTFRVTGLVLAGYLYDPARNVMGENSIAVP